MREHQPITHTMKISEVRGQLNTLVNRVFRKEARVPVAALVSTEDLARLDRLDRQERERAADVAIVDEVRRAFDDVPAEDIERETDRITAEIWVEGQRQREAAAPR
jgi:hypothetical protein